MASLPWLKFKKASHRGINTLVTQLKLRFILYAGLAVGFILLFVIGVLNSARYLQTRNEVRQVITFIAKNDGDLSKTSDFENGITEDAINTYRYFSAFVSEDGEIISYNASNLSDLTDEEVEHYTHQLADKDKGYGEFRHNRQNYSYLVTDSQNNKDEKLIIVLNSTYFYADTHALGRLSLWLGLLNLTFFILVISVVANRVVDPFVENYKKQKRFITNAGHELKTPLAIISANNELIEMMNGESEWTKSTNDQVTRLTGLINGLVALSRLEEQTELVLSPLDFSHIAEDAAEDFKGPVIKDGKSFNMVIQPNITVKAEERSLFELVTLLVDNANKYCDPGGDVTVKLTAVGRRKKRAKLEISNTYAAGAEVDYNRFFERFYREDESHNSSNQGYGIGLSTAESIVKIFKGKIFASYKDGILTMTVLI